MVTTNDWPHVYVHGKQRNKNKNKNKKKNGRVGTNYTPIIITINIITAISIIDELHYKIVPSVVCDYGTMINNRARTCLYYYWSDVIHEAWMGSEGWFYDDNSLPHKTQRFSLFNERFIGATCSILKQRIPPLKTYYLSRYIFLCAKRSIGGWRRGGCRGTPPYFRRSTRSWFRNRRFRSRMSWGGYGRTTRQLRKCMLHIGPRLRLRRGGRSPFGASFCGVSWSLARVPRPLLRCGLLNLSHCFNYGGMNPQQLLWNGQLRCAELIASKKMFPTRATIRGAPFFFSERFLDFGA